MLTGKIKTPLCETLGIQYPIIQAGMGPLDTTDLAAAVSSAGGLGVVSVPYSAGIEGGPRTIIEYLHKVKRNTDKNFAINTPIGSEKALSRKALDAFDSIIDAAVKEKQNDPDLRERLVLYITSGGNPKRHHQKIKDAGFIHFHVVGSARHARAMEGLGLDGVIASGYEMGGHTHLADRSIHTFVLVPSVAQAVNIQVVASGGICDAATFVAALAMGAVGVQMGTRFITTKECEFHDNYKECVRDADEYRDMVVPCFIGPARVLKSQGAYDSVKTQAKADRGDLSQEEKQKAMVAAWTVAQDKGDPRGLMAAGQVSSRIRDISNVKEVIDSIIRGSAEIIKELQL
ncbi:MAG: nitronate monooxygenase family protein, partial [Thermodesulfobacteriota bacterium]|nr:nitronate monooxygenase family protein [Thermodesulfobacteriota bacterium]